MKISVYALLWCTYLCMFAGDVDILPAGNGVPVNQPVPETSAPAANVPTAPQVTIPANATADVLRDAIALLNINSGFTAEPTVTNQADQLLYAIFGHDNYIQLQNPQHAAVKQIVTTLVEANPTIAPEYVLRAYLVQRGAQRPTTQPTPAAAPTDGTAGQPPRPAKPPKKPTTPATPTPPAPTPRPTPSGGALDLKPINDAVGKLNGALARIRNAKAVKMQGEQRAMLKKEAEKLLKENNSKLKPMAQRINRILAEPGFAGNPDKVAPFKRFAELYDAIEKEVLRP
jgi:hypothetical protein